MHDVSDHGVGGSGGEPSAADTGAAVGTEMLAGQLSDLARNLQAEDDPQMLLGEIVSAAVAMIPGTDAGSISLVTDRRHVTSQAPSSNLAEHIDTLQDSTGEGPCLDAAYHQQTVRVADLATETRWPRFAQHASQAGAAAMLSFQLFVDGDNLGALNLYSRTPHAFDDESEHIGLLFASHAAVAFAGARTQQHLTRAVDTRDLIGMAKGILMERYTLTGDRAFAVLVRSSQHTQRKLSDIAAELVEHRTLPGHHTTPPDGEHPKPR